MNGNVKGAFLMMGSMAFFTFNDTFMKSLSDELPLFQALFLRGAVTCVLLFGLAWYFRGFRLKMSARNWKLVTIRTCSEIAAAYFFVTALFNMPIANVTAVLQALPLAVSLAGALFLGEAIGWRRLLAICVGFAGVLLIVQPGADGFNIYSVYALATVVVVTIRDLAARRLDADVPSLTVAWLGAVGVTLFSGMASFTETWVVPSPLAWMQLGGAVTFIIGAYILSVMTMRVGDIASVSPFRYTGLLWAMLMGLLVFGDWPDTLTLVGSSIVVATGIFTLLRERRLGKRATPLGPRIR
jgi:S-adenosylmethionine uptake transporter